jgi:putative transposase
VNSASPSDRGYRSPAEAIAQSVRLYYRFPFSYRGVEELLFERGVVVSYETIRAWCLTFGPAVAAALKRRRPQPKGQWHLDEMFIKMRGKTYDLWRAVDADGMVLDILVQERRHQEAAEAFLRRVVEGYPEAPRVTVTDKLASDGPAIKKILPRTEHRRHKGLNKRAENSHQPTRQRERAMRRFKSPGQAQHFLEPFGPIREHFCPGRHRLSATVYRATLRRRFAVWHEVTGTAALPSPSRE